MQLLTNSSYATITIAKKPPPSPQVDENKCHTVTLF